MIWNIQFVSITMAVINVNVMSVTKIRDSQTDIGPTISNFCWSWTGPMCENF